jgi:CHAT domain-containing protein
VLAGLAATRRAFLDPSIGAYRDIHVATHTFLNLQYPEQSGLMLSLVDRKGRPQEGFVRVGDIYALKLSADLIVLSSCDSGLGRDLSSEGIIGLPRAFLRAGARSVVATLWKVDDAATADFMKKFYSHFSRGETPASALRKAQLQMQRQTNWSEPYYWAAFVIQGDYK